MAGFSTAGYPLGGDDADSWAGRGTACMRRHRYEAAPGSFGPAPDRYWLASRASPNFVPETMTLTFPDGDTGPFDGQMGLPAVTHRA